MMKIIRDGEEIVLTERELVDAYFEQQHLFDLEDIRMYFADYSDDDLMDEYGLTRDEVKARIPKIADDYRRNMDKYEIGWYEAREIAIAEGMGQ